MAKAVKFFVGSANHVANKVQLLNGKVGMVEVAQSESGTWFIRVQDISGRPVWSKWEVLSQDFISFVNEIYNDFKKEIVTLKKPGLWLGGYPDQLIGQRVVMIDETGKKAVRLPS